MGIISTITAYNGTLLLIAKVVAILVATAIAAKIFDRVIERRFQRLSSKMDMSTTSYTLIKKLAGAGIYLIGISLAIYTVPGLRELSVAMMASAGFLGIIVGFAAQTALSNLIAGIFVAIFQPFRVGDSLTTRDHYGHVEDITLRHTVINTPDNDRVIVPNAKILDDYIINHSIQDEKQRFKLDIGIAYNEDIDHARELMLDEAKQHELVLDQKDTQPRVVVTETGDSAVVLRLFLWGSDRGDAWNATQEIREAIKKRFDDEGITIPFPQRTISYADSVKKEDR